MTIVAFVLLKSVLGQAQEPGSTAPAPSGKKRPEAETSEKIKQPWYKPRRSYIASKDLPHNIFALSHDTCCRGSVSFPMSLC